jgi:hypothetical protein
MRNVIARPTTTEKMIAACAWLTGGMDDNDLGHYFTMLFVVRFCPAELGDRRSKLTLIGWSVVLLNSSETAGGGC